MPLVPPPHKSTQQQVGSPRQHLLGVSEEPCTLLEPQGGTRTCSRWWTGRTGPMLNSIPIRASQAARLSSCYFYISGPLSRALILLPTPDEHFQTTFIWSCISSACVPPSTPCVLKAPAHMPPSVWDGCFPPTYHTEHAGPFPGSFSSLCSSFNKCSGHHISVVCVLMASRVLRDPEGQGYIFFTSYSLGIVIFYCCNKLPKM